MDDVWDDVISDRDDVIEVSFDVCNDVTSEWGVE